MKLESSGPGHGPAPKQKLSVRHVSLIDEGKTAAQPAPVQKRPPNCGTSYCSCIECLMPPAQPAPVKVWEAEGYDALMQEMQMVKARNIRQHAEIERLKAAQPAVPDAMTSADIQEHIEYVAGWNDCRAEMLKARSNT
jgi:hypothetical protein